MESRYFNGGIQQTSPATEGLEVPEPEYLPPSQPGDGPGWMSKRTRVIVTVVLVVIVLISAFPVATHFSSPETYTAVNQTLDDQKSTALGLVATATTASVAVSAIPDDVGTPIANQLADLSGKLAVVLAIIYLEKFLLTTFGLIAFRWFVPAGIFLLCLWMWLRGRWSPSRVLFVWGVKLLVVALALATLVPVSAGLTQTITTQYQTSLAAEEASQEANQTSETVYEDNASQDTGESQNILEMLGSAISSGVDALASGAADAANAVGEQLNKLIDAVAVNIVTSCLVPLAVLLLYFWLIKLFTGADLTGYVSKAQGAVGSAVRGAGSAARGAVKRHRASTSK
jgi:hypothetical protein